MNKLALGTVQFGLDYGISNSTGKVSDSEVSELLRMASEKGVNILDSAHIYGDSEERLGKFVPESGKEFKLISKLPAEADSVINYFEESLEKLNCSTLYAYMFHRYDTWKKKPGLWDEMCQLRAENKVERIGFSLYLPEELEDILRNNLDIDIIQIPYSIFDRRFEKFFRELENRGVEIHVRSTFLQGLYFCDPETLDPFFESAKDKIRQLKQIAQESHIPLSALALGFAHCQREIDRLVIGVSCVSDLEENLKYVDFIDHVAPYMGLLEELKIDDEKILLPYLWPSK